MRQPIRVMFLTSIRDVGGDDKNGQIVETADGPKYMMGAIEHIIRETLPGGALRGVVDVVSVVTDDTEEDCRRSGYAASPNGSGNWIFPKDLFASGFSFPAINLVTNIPSKFRYKLRMKDREWPEAKRAFEREILREMWFCGADVIISDHYMLRLEHPISDKAGLYGRILNIHPAVTEKDCRFCFRGKSPTLDAINMARTGVETRTGATLHIVNEVLDDGPVIEWAAPTPVYPSDTPQALRWRNYQMAKRPVLTRGLLRYALEVYPRFASAA